MAVPFAFGTMRLTGAGFWGPPTDRAASERLLREAIERGVTTFDTADAYGPGVTDELIASAGGPRLSSLTVIAKVGIERPARDVWRPAGSARELRAACERCLRRLRTECVDLLLLHCVDPEVPIEESVGALSACADAGLCRGVGVCNVDERQLDRAAAVAKVAAVQNHLNVRHPEHLRLAGRCAERGIRFFGWWPLAGGALATDASVVATARTRGLSAAELALAWVRHRAPASTPIVGITRRTELEQALRGSRSSLDEATVSALEAIPA